MMPSQEPRENLAAALSVLCEDAIFAIAGSVRLDVEMLRALAQRRAPAIGAAVRGTPPLGMDQWEPWILTLCAAIAPIAPPRWVPLADAIHEGLSLQHGARGVRSLFTTKPSDKETARIRAMGALAARTVTSVLAATGAFTPDARLLRSALIASLGLPEEDRRQLDGEIPVAAELLDLRSDLDRKLARSLVRAGFYVARTDGTDPREEQAVIAIARKLGLTTEEVDQTREEARTILESAKDFGEASVDATRYLLEGDKGASDRFAVATAWLTLSAIQRHEAITAVNVGSPVILAKRHRLDRNRRAAALGISWLAAVYGNPTYIRRAELVSRHDRVAADLGDEADGALIRGALDRFIEIELGNAARAPAT